MMRIDMDGLPGRGDPGLHARALERWHEAGAADPLVGSFAADALAHPEIAALIDAVAAHSPYLGQLLVREQAAARMTMEDGPDAAAAAVLATLAEGTDDDTDALMARLRIAKRRLALITALADIAGAWPLERVTGALSDLAEAALTRAARHLLARAAAAGDLILPDPADPAAGSGLIVLAMGKFGARELNYSSDIDLIILYDDGIVRTGRPDRLARTFIRIARDLVRIMEERTKDGYVFRTDLRLRPDPGATPLALSVSAAEGYYGSLGQNWERAAMIKARPVAGDLTAGRAFTRLIAPWVWRRNLDFAAIQDIHSIKRQINAHRGFRSTAVRGHNVKLGRGGIREIEFFAQTQQLIFGGRNPALRVAPTCAALAALAAAGRIAPATARELDEAYHYLRRVEHRLQMIDDQQTHTIPADADGAGAVARFLGYAGEQDFSTALLAVLGRVEDHYAALFDEAPPLTGPGNLVFTGAEDDPDTIASLTAMGFANPSGVAASVRAWHHGRYRATRSTRARELLTELVPALLAAIGRTASPDEAFGRFDAFLARLPAGVPLFSLFHANPALLDLVAEVMGTAPRLADMLGRNPARLDSVLMPGFFERLPAHDELTADLVTALAGAQDFQDALIVLHRWTDDHRFRAGVHILRGLSDGDRTGRFLADIAALTVATLAERVEDEFTRRHGRFDGRRMAVVAMGKLGGRQMSIQSDLDLITVYDTGGIAQSDGEKPLSPNEYHIRLTQRLLTALTAPSGEGKLYEVDLRLRPSGNAGPLACSLESFAQYHASSAWTWEHMALTRARVISGDETLRRDLADAIRAVLVRPRDPDQLLHDVADMRRRIDREFGTEDPWAVKYVRGGFIDIEFIAQYLMLRHAHRHPDVLDSNTADALTKLARAGLIEAETATDLLDALRLWRRVQGVARLTDQERFDETATPAGLKAVMARATAGEAGPAVTLVDFAALETRIRTAASRAYDHYRRIIEEPDSRLAPAADGPAPPNSPLENTGP